MQKQTWQHSLTLCGEADMMACARALSQHLSGDECILLNGGLGAGKTTFARGLIRALCGERTEVVSPTFMLVQDYDAQPNRGGFRIQHYDLYRLERPDELWELGLDEVLGGALVLVEWPDVADGYWPDDRLEIMVEHDASDNDCRRLQLTAHGSMVAPSQQFCRQWEAA